MRVFLNKLKQPIYKDDLIHVLIHGFLTALFMGAVLGSIDYFIRVNTNGMSFSILIIAIGYLVGKRIRSNYYNYHLLYSILAVFFTIVGYYVFHAMIIIQITKNFRILSLYIFRFLLPWNGYFFSFENIWNVLIFAITVYIAYIYSKNAFFD